MPNNYYNRIQPDFIPFTKARSGEVDNELNAVVAGFDLLPTNSAALTTGTATFGVDSGTADAKAIAMPDTRTAQADGDEVVFINLVENTGAVTVNIDGLGATSLVRSDGSALSAGDLVAGLIYSMRYDATNARYQMMMITDSYLADAQASVIAAAASEAAAAISEGNAATSEINAAISAAAALVSQTAAEDWAIRAEDDPVPPASGGDGATTYSAFHWAQKAAGSSGLPLASLSQTLYYDGGAWVATDAVSVDPAAAITLDYAGNIALQTTVSGADVRHPTAATPDLGLRNNSNALLGQLGVVGSTVRVRNRTNGADVSLTANNLAGTEQTLFNGDPDDAAVLYFAGVDKLATNVGGVYVRGSSNAAIGGNQTANITIQTSGGTDLGFLGFTGDNGMVLRNQNHGGEVIISAEDTGGSVREMFNGDPDAATFIYADTDITLRVNAGAENALFADANGAVSLYFNGVETVKTRANGWQIGSATPIFEFQDAAFTTRLAYMFMDVGSSLQIRSESSGDLVQLQGDDTGGVARNLFVGDPDGSVQLYFDGLEAFATQTNGIEVIGRSVVGQSEIELQDATTQLGAMLYSGGVMYMQSVINSDILIIRGRNSVGANTSVFNGDPDGAATLYHAGNAHILTQTSGMQLRPAGPTDNTQLLLENSAGGNVAQMLSNQGSSDLIIDNLIDGGNLELRATDAGGVVRDLFIGDPDGAVTLHHDATSVARTATAATGGFEVNNTDTGAGFERALTESDLSAEVKRKDTDTSRTSTVTLADDPDLAGWSLEANQMYEINAVLVVNCQAGGTTPGFQLAWQYSGSFGTGSQMGYLNRDNAGAVIQQDGTTGGISFDMAVSDSHVWIRGYFRVSTAGTLDFQWAQGASSANFTRLEAGSFITVRNMRLGSTGTSAVHS